MSQTVYDIENQRQHVQFYSATQLWALPSTLSDQLSDIMILKFKLTSVSINLDELALIRGLMAEVVIHLEDRWNTCEILSSLEESNASFL